jgi:hypothetical protein
MPIHQVRSVSEFQVTSTGATNQTMMPSVKNERDTISFIRVDGKKDDKSFWTRTVESICKLPCVGPIFARLFGVQVDKDSLDVNEKNKSSSEAEKKAKAACLAPFEKGKPGAKGLKAAQDAFPPLSLRAKLEVLRDLHENDNCDAKTLMQFIKLLPPGSYKELCKLTDGGEDTVKACAKDKDDDVRDAINQYIENETTAADTAKKKKIFAIFGKDEYPKAEDRAKSVQLFATIEDEASKLEALRDMMHSNHMTNATVRQFAEALPGPKKPVAKADGDKSGASGVKKGEKKDKGGDKDADAVKKDPTLQERFFAQIKDQLGDREQEALEQYNQAKADYQAAKDGAKKLNMKFDEQFKEVAPIIPKTLGEYFARRNDQEIRGTIDEVLDEMIDALRNS